MRRTSTREHFFSPFFFQRLSLSWRNEAPGSLGGRRVFAGDVPRLFENSARFFLFRNTLSNPKGVHSGFFWKRSSSSGITLRALFGLPDT
jgi:hypothetical protein